MGLRRVVGPSGRMVVRSLARRPWRFALSAAGVGMAIALLVLGLFFVDAIDALISTEFEIAQRQDLTVTFVEPRSKKALHELERFPGVLRVEAFRTVPVRLRSGHRTRRVALLGLPQNPELRRVVDRHRGPLALQGEGVMLSAALADRLGVREGDFLRVEALEGARPQGRVRVTSRIEDTLGLSAFMEAGALARFLREDQSLSGAHLQVDAAQVDTLYPALKATPDIAGVGLHSAAVRSFRDTVRANLMRIILFNVAFAGVIAFGVVYNAARISLSERSRDLASMRVLGFTRREIAGILMGELAAVTVAAIPVGVLAGSGLAWLTLAVLDNELYRIPLVIDASTYGWAIVTIAAASLASGGLVCRRLNRLDLVAVLKTRE